MQVLTLSAEAVHRGLVTSSSGNHALAFLFACSLLPANSLEAAETNQRSTLAPAEHCPLSQPADTHELQPNSTSSDVSSSVDLAMNGGRSAAAPAPCIYLPVCVSAFKLTKLQDQGAQVVLHGTDVVEAEVEGRRVADVAGSTFVSPYNDAEVRVSTNVLLV